MFARATHTPLHLRRRKKAKASVCPVSMRTRRFRPPFTPTQRINYRCRWRATRSHKSLSPNLGALAIRSIVATVIADVLDDIRASAFTYGTSASVSLHLAPA